MEWEQRLEIIKKRIKEVLAEQDKRDTDENAAKLFNISAPTYSKWKNNRQMPDVKTFQALALKLGMSADWLLLGKGEPFVGLEISSHEHDKYVADTLRDLVVKIGEPLDEISMKGELYNDELKLIIDRRLPLPSRAIQRWVHNYRINANFLLAQVGQPFLTDEEYEAPGPYSWLRKQIENESWYPETPITPKKGAVPSKEPKTLPAEEGNFSGETPPHLHIDEELLLQMADLLENFLTKMNNPMPLRDKVKIVHQLYEKAMQHHNGELSDPIDTIRIINRALTKAETE